MPPSGNIQGTFDQKTGASGSVSYAHPHEKEILKKARMVLKQSATGARLLEVIESRKIPVHVIKNRNAHGMSPDKSTVYVGLPPSQEEPDAHMILELGGGLRSMEQEIMGFTVPDEEKDPLGAATMKHAKFLDIVVHMCKIGHELTESSSIADYINAIEALGHGEIYQAHLEQSGDREMVEAYARAREKAGKQ